MSASDAEKYIKLAKKLERLATTDGLVIERDYSRSQGPAIRISHAELDSETSDLLLAATNDKTAAAGGRQLIKDLFKEAAKLARSRAQRELDSETARLESVREQLANV
jgi:hypothetical protein